MHAPAKFGKASLPGRVMAMKRPGEIREDLEIQEVVLMPLMNLDAIIPEQRFEAGTTMSSFNSNFD